MSRRRQARAKGKVQVSQLEEQLRLLDAEKDAFMRHFEERRSLLLRQPCGILSVPPEILSETFSHLIDGDSRNVIPPSHVCSLWRETALQDSSLWTYIRLGDKNEYKRIALAFLKTCIGRARGGLLSISVEPHNQYVSPEAYILAIYQALTTTKNSKWESFSLTTAQITDCALLLTSLATESAPTVKTLSVTCIDRKYDWPFDGLLPDKLLDLQTMPILKNLTLDFSNQLRQAKVSIFWDRLTTLKLTSKMRSTEYLSILRLCDNLESCSISPKTRDDRDALKGSYEPVHLVKLKKLEIVSYWVPSLVAAQLVCPVLEEAIIQFEACYHEEAELASFFKKCAATLQVLKVPGSFCRVDKWARPLENLQELTVTGGYDWDDVDSDHGATSFFTPLIVTRSRTLLPRLKIIRAVEQDKWSKHAVNAVLFEVVKSRMQGKRNLAKLQCIVFKMAYRVEGKMDEYRRQYQKWETDGLKVDLND